MQTGLCLPGPAALPRWVPLSVAARQARAPSRGPLDCCAVAASASAQRGVDRARSRRSRQPGISDPLGASRAGEALLPIGEAHVLGADLAAGGRRMNEAVVADVDADVGESPL